MGAERRMRREGQRRVWTETRRALREAGCRCRLVVGRRQGYVQHEESCPLCPDDRWEVDGRVIHFRARSGRSLRDALAEFVKAVGAEP